ncbi:MAG: hypothetical protein SAJ12_10715 [Jaaginema sp. PMC 1079.18]|nr:hypothetical protein [Jaaginema sp. PMC 1080.18]MEC4851474.1 hypothetical protein [Jaaginema sp. PMC 1079.18]MEC4867825.1 hypothetical protein [Jaaginema sp. PMC 1078.18]
MAKNKIGTKKVDTGERVLRRTPLEDAFNLASLLGVDLNGHRLGAAILQKGQDNYKVQFGFDCRGIHPTLIPSQIEPTFDAIEAGLKDLPPGEYMTIHLGSFIDDSQRQRELKRRIARTNSTELQYLLMTERERVAQLTEAGIRQEKCLRIYCTYTVDRTGKAGDKLEKFLAGLERFWRTFTGEIDTVRALALEQILYGAFTDGYRLWQQLLSNKMGLDVRPLSPSDIWADQWRRLNQSEPRRLPQLVVLDEAGLREEIYSEVHPTTLLMETETSIPVADRRWVNCNGRYQGILTFSDKPGGWPNKYAQLRYLWEVMAREAVFDTEIFCQVTRASSGLVKSRLQSLTKQSNVAALEANRKNAVDVGASLKAKKAIAAQEEILEGSETVRMGVVFVVHRRQQSQLDEACRYLSSLFLRPAWVERETEYPWRIWLQTFPLMWEKLLAKPFERRNFYLTQEAPGLMPLVKTKTVDSQGFELIAEEGGTPIYLDLYSQHRNLALFGTTRSGKSVLAAGLITTALAEGMPVVAMDYPKPDGSSTFSDYTRFLGEKGAYFDIGRESSNLFELPNLRGLEPKQQTERLEDYKSFLGECLLTMVMGKDGAITAELRRLADTVRSILGIAIDSFFRDDLIADRYAAAYQQGFGSAEWQDMPTLKDFVGFCSVERLNLSVIAGDIKAGFEQVQLRLKYWLSTRVGKAISQPSTFRTDAQFLVFALRNLSNEADAAILSLAAYSAALRRALAAPRSIFFIDEAPILFEYGSISALVGRLCANGAKAGIRVILSAQDPDTIYASPGSAKIFQNLNTRLIGRIQPTAVDSFCDILKYPQEIIAVNGTDSFFPRQEGLYSRWLLDDNGTYTHCRYYPGIGLLGAVANNPDEQAARTETLSQHQDKIRGMHEFSRQLAASLRQS